MPLTLPLRSLALAVSVISTASSLAAEEASRGEAVFQTAWRTLPRYLLGCATSNEACSPDSEVVAQIRKLSQARPFSKPNPLRFVSGRERPGLFTAGDETHRMAVTGLSANSEIFINTDVIDSVSFEEALGLLAHEVTHHLGLKDDAARLPDRIASAVRAHALASTESWSWKLAGSSRPLLLRLHNPPRPSEEASGVKTDKERINFPAVWIELEDRVYDLSHVWVGLPWCPYGTTDLGWVRYESPQKDLGAESLGEDLAQVLVRMKASSVCLMGDGRKLSFTSAIGAKINLEAARRAGGTWQLTNRTRIEFRREDSQETLASITKIRTSSTSVKNGETLTIDAEIRSRTPLENFCVIDIASDEFKFRRPSGAALSIPLSGDSCQITKIDSQNYRMRGIFKVPETTPSRSYHVLRLRPYSHEVNDLGGYVDLPPPSRTSFSVKSTRSAPAPKVVSYGVELGRDKGVEKAGARPILWCQKYLFRVKLQDSPGYLWRSGELGFDVHRVQGEPLPYFTEPDDRTLYIPIHEGALYLKQYDEMTDPQGIHSFYFAMKFSEEFSFHNEIASELVFRDFVFLTKDLQEVKISFNEPSLSLKMAPPQIHPTCGFY